MKYFKVVEERSLLQRYKVKYRKFLQDGKFTKAFKRENNALIGVTEAALLLSVASTAIFVTTIVVATGGLALLPFLALAVVAPIALLARRFFLKRKKKYRTIESMILEEKNANELAKKDIQLEQFPEGAKQQEQGFPNNFPKQSSIVKKKYSPFAYNN